MSAFTPEHDHSKNFLDQILIFFLNQILKNTYNYDVISIAVVYVIHAWIWNKAYPQISSMLEILMQPKIKPNAILQDILWVLMKENVYKGEHIEMKMKPTATKI